MNESQYVIWGGVGMAMMLVGGSIIIPTTSFFEALWVIFGLALFVIGWDVTRADAFLLVRTFYRTERKKIDEEMAKRYARLHKVLEEDRMRKSDAEEVKG